jgi:hypothetical protein
MHAGVIVNGVAAVHVADREVAVVDDDLGDEFDVQIRPPRSSPDRSALRTARTRRPSGFWGR